MGTVTNAIGFLKIVHKASNPDDVEIQNSHLDAKNISKKCS